MDISKKAVAETAALHIKDANGEPMYADDARRQPVKIIIYGPSSNAFSVVEARQAARAVKRMEDNDGKVALLSPEERRKEAAEDLADVTVAFENFTYSPAGDAQGRELYKAVYNDPALGFIVKQVRQGVQDWGKFAGA